MPARDAAFQSGPAQRGEGMASSAVALVIVVLITGVIFVPLFFPQKFKAFLQGAGYVFGVGLLYLVLYSVFGP